MTAGTSAPEHLVENLIGRLLKDYGGHVETRSLIEEDIVFNLPLRARLSVLN